MKNQNATIRVVDVYPYNEFQEMAVGRPIAVTVKYKGTGILSDEKSRTEIVIADGSPTHDQQQMEYDHLEAEVAKKIQQKGTDQDESVPWHVDSQSRILLDGEPEALANGTKTLYMMTHVEWKNQSGSTSTMDKCNLMVSPIPHSLILTHSNLWANCVAHSSGTD